MSNRTFDAWLPSIENLERVVAIPASPLRYGADLSCTLDLPADYAEVSPDSVQAIGEALIRRLITPRGGLLDDPDYGAGVSQMLNHGITLADFRQLEQLIESECRKDDRVAQCTVSVTPDNPLSSGQVFIAISVQPQDTNQTFELTLTLNGSGRILEALVLPAVI